ncbi:MAG: energy transducer TonB [Polynucleobacter sp.]
MVLASSRQWRLPFSRDEGIIIALVVLAHLSLIIPFQFGLSPKPPDYQNDERVMANLLAPEAPQAPAKAATPPAPKPAVEAPRPTPKPEPKKPEKSVAPAPNPTPAQKTAATTETATAKPSESTQNASVAPPTGGGGISGTPIQTDIGKLVVVYQPDADPYYPSFSKRAGEQGEVVVRLIISESGEVEEARLLQSSSYPRLDRAAMEIGKRYRFKPYTINGSPTKISTNLLIKFNLKSP